MSLPAILRTLAESYRLLPDLLSTDRGQTSDISGIRAPKQPHSPAPISLEVSDLITDIGKAAAAWEYELCRVFWLPAPYWTTHRTVAVPRSLQWSAGTLENPPANHEEWWQPATVPDDVHTWMERVALDLNERVGPLVWHVSEHVVRPETSCPLCGGHTLIGRTSSPELRCVTAGCGYVRRVAV